MQKTQQLVSIGHITYPGIPCGILQAITKASEDECDHKYWVRWMCAVHDVGDQMATWSYKCHTTLA